MPEILTTTRLTVTPLAGHIGAEISGADTGAPLADEVIAQIRQALLDHKVVFLRGQSLDYRRWAATPSGPAPYSVSPHRRRGT